MEPQPPKPIERRGIRRGIYILPSLFTVGTLVCGYYAILSTQRAGQISGRRGLPARYLLRRQPYYALAAVAFDNAAKAIGWAIVFDGFDGRIARMTNTASAFGRELDSWLMSSPSVWRRRYWLMFGDAGVGDLAANPRTHSASPRDGRDPHLRLRHLRGGAPGAFQH